MNVRDEFTGALDEYRRNMKVSGGDLTFQAGDHLLLGELPSRKRNGS
jgi:hypothetical protein